MAKRRRKRTKTQKPVKAGYRYLLAALTVLLFVCTWHVLGEKETTYDAKLYVVNETSAPVYAKPTTTAEKTHTLSRGMSILVDADVTYLQQPWRRVAFYISGTLHTGYMEPNDLTAYTFDADFEDDIADFPETYRQPLRLVHTLYPKWTFTKYESGLDFSDTAKVYQKKSLISSDDEDLIVSGKIIEGTVWRRANLKTVRYYLDPRNGLRAAGALMFETMVYADSDDETMAEALLEDTFMSGTEDISGTTWASLFANAAKTYNVNLSNLIARAIQEQNGYGTLDEAGLGAQGATATDDTSGTLYYNIFNIGANTGVQAGIDYACAQGWDTREKAINGGAKYLAETYIDTGQDTLYLQRFDINRTNIGTHTYMTNISAPYDEGSHLMTIYDTAGITDSARALSVPVYKNMPKHTVYPGDASGYNLSVYDAYFYRTMADASVSYTEEAATADDVLATLRVSYDKDALRDNVDYAVSTKVDGQILTITLTGLGQYHKSRTVEARLTEEVS